VTIKNDGGEKVCTCDADEGCDVFEYSGVLDFTEFVKLLQRNGWKIRKVDDEWFHYCPDHAADVT
jgi:hypothetical protein